MDAHDRHNAAQDAAIASLQALAISPTSPGSSGWQRACHTAEPANHFVGREAALQTLQQLLAEKQRRVVALSGAVGMVYSLALLQPKQWHMHVCAYHAMHACCFAVEDGMLGCKGAEAELAVGEEWR